MTSARKGQRCVTTRPRGAFLVALAGLSALASCQLVGDFDEPYSTPQPPGLRLAARASYACAWVVGGEAQCWGGRPLSAIGPDGGDYLPSYVQEREGNALSGVAELALGNEHSCARLVDGRVKCWGSNAYGQLGVPASADGDDRSTVPVFVEDQTSNEGRLANVVSVSLGRYHSCALLDDGHGRVMCWGSNARGQVGAAVLEGGKAYSPVVVEEHGHTDLTDVIELSLGNDHSCALLSGGRVKCWGSNAYGQLGRQVEGDSDASPGLVQGLEWVEEISVGGDQSCARLSDGHVTCWGGAYGPYPTPVEDHRDGDDGLLSGAVELESGGSSYNCVRGADKVVKCWQRITNPKVDGDAADVAPAMRLALLERIIADDAPEPVKDENGAPLRDVAELALGDEHGCARLVDGSVECWGSNAAGQLGNPTRAGDPEPIAYPIPVEGLTLLR
jgi:Regulator of chromosome condensation (RCC1) repeat